MAIRATAEIGNLLRAELRDLVFAVPQSQHRSLISAARTLDATDVRTGTPADDHVVTIALSGRRGAEGASDDTAAVATVRRISVQDLDATKAIHFLPRALIGQLARTARTAENRTRNLSPLAPIRTTRPTQRSAVLGIIHVRAISDAHLAVLGAVGNHADDAARVHDAVGVLNEFVAGHCVTPRKR